LSSSSLPVNMNLLDQSLNRQVSKGALVVQAVGITASAYLFGQSKIFFILGKLRLLGFSISTLARSKVDMRSFRAKCSHLLSRSSRGYAGSGFSCHRTMAHHLQHRPLLCSARHSGCSCNWLHCVLPYVYTSDLSLCFVLLSIVQNH
jgi:hypothetical protein